jgi:hypothetical protein
VATGKFQAHGGEVRWRNERQISTSRSIYIYKHIRPRARHGAFKEEPTRKARDSDDVEAADGSPARDHHALQPRTLVRCAATCNLFRHEILAPSFHPRVTQAAPYILTYLCNDAKKPLAPVHPATPAALSFCHKHLLHFMARKVATLLYNYKTVACRRGLVVLRRLNIENR